ncbi:hypothetical protein [Psychroflexus salis]|uniref:Zinc carboxypeptidase n=1 Tax=Psychroflexus salis TaxID=1526574 RepID=A0A917E6N1_9FLAO|nr:hypothetical protein [Psychroflexus salis]GGE09710.1 hypothetical protein GCM10010831_09040 [Psychroflexus salis]
MKYIYLKKTFIIFTTLLLGSCTSEIDFTFSTSFEKSAGKQTATYEEAIDFYKKAADFSDRASLQKFDETDLGKPLHLFTIKPEKPAKEALSILILNGIHPGEPDGIDASMLLVKRILNASFVLPEHIILHIVPVYNIGGALHRNSTSRVNQKGPENYGFRGNALNYDLNRDFIKSDTKNSKAFYKIYHQVNPSVFIDTHVSNGADYQYTLTHLFTQTEQLGGTLGNFIKNEFIPATEKDLQTKNLPITPYVNVFNRSPSNGFTQFLDTPRYSTGYTSLWNSLGLMIETHMLKPYPERVQATLAMLESLTEQTAKYKDEIQLKRKQNFTHYNSQDQYLFNYRVDSTQFKTFQFLGYKASQNKSEVTQLNRLKYHTNQPTTYPVKYYNTFKASDSVIIPKAYVIPKAYTKIIELLQINHIKISPLKKDQVINAEVYHIANYQTSNTAYEGHYLHYNTQVNRQNEEVVVKKGDYWVETNQKGIRYLLETIEPAAVDSFFNWNFFDSILQRKEGFSPYVFEDIALQFLEKHPNINEAFLAKKLKDSVFANNAYAQLNWIYQQTNHYEKSHLRYPIYRILK